MGDSHRLILSGAKILIDNKWAEGQALVLEDGRIHAIIPERKWLNPLSALHETSSEKIVI